MAPIVNAGGDQRNQRGTGTGDSATFPVKLRDQVYKLMISQLFYDGHQALAVQLSNMVQVSQPCPPSDRLLNLVSIGLEKEKGSFGVLLLHFRYALLGKSLNNFLCVADSKTVNRLDSTILGPGLDLEFETEVPVSAPEPALYETAYVTAHKGNCRAGAFSPDGQLCATGSVDASIKILDVERMLAKSAPDAEGGSSTSGPANEVQGHPVIRTLYDHFEEVTTLQFHPTLPFLASGSRDHTIKIFDYAKASAKKASKTYTDADQVRCISFHPSGDYLLAATNHPVIRLYDVNTGQCYVCSIPAHQHKGAVLFIKYSNDGKQYVSASRDGSIKIWDAVSNRCINTFQQAHEGIEVCSVMYSRNGKYVLSAGKDSLVKLWELSTSRCLIAYTGAGTAGKQNHRAHAVFNHTEDYVLFPDEATISLCAWDSRNAARKKLLSLGHNGPVRYLIHSAVSPAFLSCSDDFRARFWYRRTHSATH
ncbi:unnamed protein product [Darwinula stevensoni]|uniref:Cleavage stimulation factor 50 kDa subunit n=1 Tax=Darwinula stevensoni TaxID=69355 RepID=A0A7R9A1B7_9CRUS|nr:unnamed protein product [Darwinula stevensoni]CAG0883135.1 unnamed protein product [Darwinula stevensoni]